MIKITLEQLQEMNACEDGIQWFLEHKITRLKPLVIALLKDNKKSYAYWLLSHLMSQPQNVRWAVYSAKTCLSRFEKHYPDDKRPRQAIQAAKNYLAGKIDGSAAESAASAARSAAESAAWSAARSAAESAASAAWSAANLAESAAYAAYAAESAAWSAARSAAESAAWAAATKKTMFYALKLLGE